ncbi:hypothetical protein [uncultured Chryseobacterium sp.]|uniref:hypothetical protein n=1 Tax=uncultured Chryseobacterium sp. TaxID=259322 RepID=UPI0025E2E92E|nr:hypothetical protein [uncultured Chryseobacterium sp.]
MNIIIYSDNISNLNSKLAHKIDNDLKTWTAKSATDNSTLYYHTTKSEQWENDLYLKPFIDKDKGTLTFKITKINGIPLKFASEFGYLIGRFTQILIVHLSDYYSKIEIK